MIRAGRNAAGLPRARWGIAGLLGTGVLVNYFDRICLSVAGPQLEHAFGLSAVGLGLLFSAFFWSYALLQIPAGLLLDRIGVERVGRWTAFLWSVASTLTACASGFWGIFVARLLLGIAEAPTFPANSKATGYWFPRAERGMSTAMFDAASKLANVIGVPLVALAVVRLGWRWGFGLVAILSFAYFAAFSRMYRDPSRHPRVTREGRDHLIAQGAGPEGEAGASPAGLLAYLLRSRKVWGLSIGFAAYGYCFFFFLTWLPGYLVQAEHMSLLESASLTAIPWACASASGLLVGGWLVDHLIAKGCGETSVRRTVLLGGLCAGTAVIGATTAGSPIAAIAWISVALSGLAAASPVCWSLPALIAPTRGVGTVGGIMNFANNLMGAVAPIATGYVFGRTHSFTGAFLLAAAVLLIGILAVIFLLGPIEPLAEPATLVSPRAS